MSLVSMYSDAQQLRFGATAGLNVNLARGSEPCGGRLGYVVGGTAYYGFGHTAHTWYVNGSLLLSQKGYKVDNIYMPVEGGKDQQYKSHLDVTSLEIPIVIGRNFAIGGKSSVFVEAGPYVSCGLWGKTETKLDGKTVSSSHHVLGKDGYQRIDYGVTLGVGVGIADRWRLKCNYEFGIPNLVKAAAIQGMTKPTYRNGCIATTVTYMF